MGPSATTQRYSAVLDWAAWHSGVVSRAELTALGVPPGTIASWLRAGRLTRLQRGVFAVGHTALRTEGRWRAGVLATTKSALTHHTGMLALGHRVPAHEGIHLTTRAAARSRGELVVHRARLEPVDLTTRHGLPVTRVERGLVDLADELTWLELAAVADQLWTVDLPALRAARERAGHRVGRGRSGLLIAREEPHARSEFERAFLAFLRRRGLPRPTGINVRVGRFVVDAVYDEHLAVELDGRRYHERRREMRADRHRDADLQARGFRVLRLVWEDLYDEQAPETIRRLTALLALRAAS